MLLFEKKYIYILLIFYFYGMNNSGPLILNPEFNFWLSHLHPHTIKTRSSTNQIALLSFETDFDPTFQEPEEHTVLTERNVCVFVHHDVVSVWIRDLSVYFCGCACLLAFFSSPLSSKIWSIWDVRVGFPSMRFILRPKGIWYLNVLFKSSLLLFFSIHISLLISPPNQTALGRPFILHYILNSCHFYEHKTVTSSMTSLNAPCHRASNLQYGHRTQH